MWRNENIVGSDAYIVARKEKGFFLCLKKAWKFNNFSYALNEILAGILGSFNDMV